MKATFILKGKSDEFYNGGMLCVGLLNLTALEQFLYLRHISRLPEYGVSMKLGSGSFRDRVDFNSRERQGLSAPTSKIEPRRGYKLATFEFPR